MNERQAKLKTILDRWTACTLTIEQAEVELEDLLSIAVYGRPRNETLKIPLTGYVEPLEGYQLFDQTTLTASESIGVQVEPDVHKYYPETIKATVGNFEVFCDPFDRSQFACTIDGVDVRETRRIEIVIDYRERPSVKIEFCPKSRRRDKDSDAS